MNRVNIVKDVIRLEVGTFVVVRVWTSLESILTMVNLFIVFFGQHVNFLISWVVIWDKGKK